MANATSSEVNQCKVELLKHCRPLSPAEETELTCKLESVLTSRKNPVGAVWSLQIFLQLLMQILPLIAPFLNGPPAPFTPVVSVP